MISRELLMELERYGVHAVHLELLLRAIRLQRSGSIRWRWHDGAVVGCDVQLSLPGRDPALHEGLALWDGDGLREQP